MAYRYRRSGMSMNAGGPNVKRFLVGSYSALTDGNTGNIAINVPIDAANGRCIQVWSFELEFSDGTWFTTDNKTLTVVLARTAGTAERYINDPDVICKIKIHSELTTSGAVLDTQVIDKDFYTAIPCFGSQLHVTITNGTGATQTCYAKIWYTDLFMDMRQMVASLQSQVI